MDRLPSRNIETQAVCMGIDLGKPELKLGRNVKGNRKCCYDMSAEQKMQRKI